MSVAAAGAASVASASVLLLTVLRGVESRICTAQDACNFGVVACNEANIRPTCTYAYQNTNSFQNQAAAINACKTKFGPLSTLAMPGDATVNAQLFNLCGSHRFFDMRRRPAPACDQWETLDGAPISFLNFDSGEPSNGGQPCTRGIQENCVGFKFNNGNNRWHDSGCTPSGSSTTFVAQCAVCVVPPATTTTTTTTTVLAPTTSSTAFFVDFTTTTTAVAADGATQPPTTTTPPITTKTVNIGADTGKPTTNSANGSGGANVKPGSNVGDEGGLSDAALGGIIGGILCCCLCLILLLALFVRRRDKKDEELRVIVEAEPRYAPPREQVDVGQYGPTPVPNAATYKQYPNADSGASWNGGPPPPVLMGGTGGGGGGGGGGINPQYGSPDHTRTLVGNSAGMQSFHDFNADARALPPAAYFPSSGANDLPSLPPYPQGGFNNQWQQPGPFYAPQYSAEHQPQQFMPQEEQFDSGSLRARDEASTYGASNLFQSVRDGSQQEEYGNLNLRQETSTYGLH